MAKRKKYGKPRWELTLVTPKIAQEFLDTQIEKQRPLTVNHVAEYADAMERNLFLFDGTTIKFDWYGRMIDGQFRCHAIIKSGKRQRVLIVYGLNPDVFKVLDSGKKRTLGDTFNIRGEVSSNQLAAAVGLLWRHGKHKFLTHSNKKPQREDAIELLRKHPKLRISLKKAYPAKDILVQTVGGFLHYIFSQKNEEQADEFFEKLASGEGFKKKDPIRVLRDAFIRNRAKAGVHKKNRVYIIAIAIKAWNAFRQNRSLSGLSWRENNPDEPMPKVI